MSSRLGYHAGMNTRTRLPWLWILVALIGAFSLAQVAVFRGETVNAAWLLAAAVCTYLLAYRFYAAWIAAKVLSVDATRATPAERLDNGRDFVTTHRWVVFGHHFAAIAGPGPLIGPTLAAQFGYLPGTLWILAGGVLGGAVQDMVVLFLSTRRDGRSSTDSSTGRGSTRWASAVGSPATSSPMSAWSR